MACVFCSAADRNSPDVRLDLSGLLDRHLVCALSRLRPEVVPACTDQKSHIAVNSLAATVGCAGTRSLGAWKDSRMIGAALTSAQNWELVALTFGTLAVTAVFTALGGTRTLSAHQIHLNSRMGQLTWDFTQSFATNIALVGSVLTVILTSNVLPSDPSETTILPSGAYAGLGVFFGVLVIIAPILYNGTADRVTVSSDHFDTAAEYHGTVWGFLVAATATCWGLLGSLATAFVTLLELEYDGDLALAAVVLLAIVLTATVAFFGRYTWVKMDGTIVDQFDPAEQAARIQRSTTVRQQMNLGAPTAAAPPPAPKWTLL